MKKFNFSKGLVIGLLTLALCLTCFGVAKVSADDTPQELTASYTAATNSITVAGNKYFVYVLKQESNNTIKAGATCFSAAANAPLTMADLGIKAATKDVYLYVCNKEFTEEGKSITANMVIKAPAAAKVVGVIDYTKADGTDPALSIIATDKSKKEIENPTAFWSKDGDSYTNASTFTGDVLAKMLSDGGATIFVKMLGTDGGSGTAQFSSKVVKVKIAKPAKAPAVKFDVAKDAFALKNGFDFAVASGTIKKPTAPDGTAGHTWFTILPVLATAETKTADDSIVATSTYKPLDKKDANAKLAIGDGNTTVSYTQYKFKNLSAETLLTKLGGTTKTEEFVLAVRKSATNKKPASEIAYVKIVPQTKAPIVLTESKVKDQYLVATSDDFTKKGIIIGSVINYPGTTGTANPAALATTGFDSTFKVVKATNKDADESAAVYEYLIVKTENIGNTGDAAVDNVDLSTGKWKKFNPAKLKLTSNLKSKYSTVGGKAVEATLKAIDKPDSFDPAGYTPADGAVILVRRAGVKGKTAEDSVRASKYQTLYVIKDDKTFELYTDTQIGDAAWQYKIQFAKYDPEEDSTNKYIVDDEMTLTGWVADDENSKAVDLPKPNGFDYILSGTVDNGKTTLGSDPAIAKDEGTGKYPVSIAKSAPTATYCIKQYANIVINIEYEPDDDAKINADKVEIKAGKLDGNYVAWVGVDVSNIDLSTLITSAAGTYTVGTITTDTTGAVVDASKKLSITATNIPSTETVTITVTVPLTTPAP